MTKYLVNRIAVVLVLVVMSISASAQVSPGSTGGETSLTLKDFTGQQQTLDQYRGKIVVLNFWATWCIPCREEMPILVELHKQYQSLDVQVIGASADEQTTQKAIPAFIRKQKIEFPIWVGATTTDMKRRGLGDALPATAIINRDGKIVYRILGPVEKTDLQTRIQWLLGDRQSPSPQAVVDNLEKLKQKTDVHKHEHAEGEEHHEHGGVGVEGASTVPS